MAPEDISGILLNVTREITEDEFPEMEVLRCSIKPVVLVQVILKF